MDIEREALAEAEIEAEEKILKFMEEEAMRWEYFNKFDKVSDMYLPPYGEGGTMATQTATAVTKLVYKWFNDGDVFDNVHTMMDGWCNDLSSYANWLYKYQPDSQPVLDRIYRCCNGAGYSDMLAALADLLMDEERLAKDNERPATGSVYYCDGPFEFGDYYDEEEEYEDYEEENDDDDEWD